MRVLLVNDTTDWYHFGCTGTSLMLRSEISNLGHEVISMPIHACMTLNDAPQAPADFFNDSLRQKFIANNPEWMMKIQAADIVVINGEGTLHGSRKGPLALLLIAHIAKTVFDRKVQIINHSVYPNDDLSTTETEILHIYKTVYALLDYTAIREPLSCELMRSIGVSAVESFDCLPLYIKQFYKVESLPKRDNLILLSGSAAWFNSNVFMPGAVPEFDVLSGLEKLIPILLEKIKDGYEVKFLQSDTSNPSKDDIEMIAYLQAKMPSSFNVILAKSLDEWLQEIQTAGLLISGRFHHSIAAACLGTKFVALNSNTPKVLGLMMALDFKAPLLYGDKDLGGKLLESIQQPLQSADPAGLTDKLCKRALLNFAGCR